MLSGQGLTPEKSLPANIAVQVAEAGRTLAGQGPGGRTVADVERDLILDTLQHCLGNRTHAANILGISIRRAAQ